MIRRIRTVVFLVCLAVFGAGCTWVVPEGVPWEFQPKRGDTVRVVMDATFMEPGGVETGQRCNQAGGLYEYSYNQMKEFCVFGF